MLYTIRAPFFSTYGLHVYNRVSYIFIKNNNRTKGLVQDMPYVCTSILITSKYVCLLLLLEVAYVPQQGLRNTKSYAYMNCFCWCCCCCLSVLKCCARFLPRGALDESMEMATFTQTELEGESDIERENAYIL